MANIGTSELLLIFLVALLVFGAKRIPEIARGLGQGIREFKDATNNIKREMNIEDAFPGNRPDQYRPYVAPPPQAPEPYGNPYADAYLPPAYPQGQSMTETTDPSQPVPEPASTPQTPGTSAPASPEQPAA